MAFFVLLIEAPKENACHTWKFMFAVFWLATFSIQLNLPSICGTILPKFKDIIWGLYVALDIVWYVYLCHLSIYYIIALKMHFHVQLIVSFLFGSNISNFFLWLKISQIHLKACLKIHSDLFINGIVAY